MLHEKPHRHGKRCGQDESRGSLKRPELCAAKTRAATAKALENKGGSMRGKQATTVSSLTHFSTPTTFHPGSTTRGTCRSGVGAGRRTSTPHPLAGSCKGACRMLRWWSQRAG